MPNDDSAEHRDSPGASATDPTDAAARQRLDAELARIEARLTELAADLRAVRRALSDAGPQVLAAPAGRRLPRWPVRGGLPSAARATVRVTAPLRAVVQSVAAGRARAEWSPRRPRWWDAAALIAIVALGLALRAVDLSDAPRGVHGDEAATGIEARRILATGWIGPYSGIAGGNPTGVYYLATIPMSLIDDPVLAVRWLEVVGGVVAVAGLYLLVRRQLGFASAVGAGVLLATSEWHIQFSRIGFVTGMWPTFAVLATIALMEAQRSRAWGWWAAAGALAAAGTYIYNGHGPLMAIMGVYALWLLFGWRALALASAAALAYVQPGAPAFALLALGLLLLASRRFRDRRAIAGAGAYGAATLLVLWELIGFVRAHPRDYFGRGDELSVFHSPAWAAAQSNASKLSFLLHRYAEFWNRLTFAPRPNGADLTGVTPLVPRITLAIFLVGGIIALVRRPVPLVVFSAGVVVALPLTAVLTDMTLRRALGMVPFLAILGGAGMVETVRLAARWRPRSGPAAGIALALLVAKSGWDNGTDFFVRTVDSNSIRHTFGIELRETSEYMNTLPDDAYVYFYSVRWGLGYDTVQLIAPDVRGENPLPLWGGNGTMAVDRAKGRPVFVFVGKDIAMAADAQRIYPGGELIVGPMERDPLNGPAFVAYFPPVGP